jgi:hypothetical protein
MTIAEMSERMVRKVGSLGSGVTFIEMVNAVGDEAKGDYELALPHLNVVLWSGVSAGFIDAFALAAPRIYPSQSHFFVYAFDGGFPNLPVAKQLKKPYKKPHWFPLVFSSHPVKPGKRQASVSLISFTPR